MYIVLFFLGCVSRGKDEAPGVFCKGRECFARLGNFRNNSDQIDIILKACSDRMDRLIECRWTHDTSSILQLINDLSKKMPFVERSKKYIISNCPLTEKVKKTAQAHRIKMIPLSDLF